MFFHKNTKMNVSLQQKEKLWAPRNLLKASAEPSFKLSMGTIHPFNHTTVVLLSLVTGTLLTLITILGNLYNVNHIAFSWSYIVLTWILNILLFYLLFLFNFSVAKREDMKKEARYAQGIIGTLIITALYTFLAKALRLWIIDEVTVQGAINVNLFKDIVAGITVLLITMMLFNITRRQQMQLENQRLNEENIRIRYDALVSQLDPHFLFNSLNTLNGLIGEDDTKAREYVQQLAQSYRYIIQTNKLVSFADELSFTNSYIYLMQIRYGDNLHIQQHILPNAMDRKVIPISLQLLIENAVKHNVVSNKHPLTITIETPNTETLRVCNNVCVKPEEPMGEKVGLANLAERYRLVCNREVAVKKNDEIFEVTIPLLSEEEQKKK